MGNTEEIRVQKNELRKEAKAYRNSLSEEERLEKSAKIAEYLKAMEAFQKSDIILMYASLPGEVETLNLMREILSEGKKEVYCPVTHGEEMEFYRVKDISELKEGNFRVLEPESLEENKFQKFSELNLCFILPGLMFDKKGNRLGYGKGYYDKYLRKIKWRMRHYTVISLSYEEMLKESLISENTDETTDWIVTECGAQYVASYKCEDIISE